MNINELKVFEHLRLAGLIMGVVEWKTPFFMDRNSTSFYRMPLILKCSHIPEQVRNWTVPQKKRVRNWLNILL